MSDDGMDLDHVEPRGTKRSAEEAGLPPSAPRRIKALPENVVNKIAAGEIIVGPVNALKEMLENSVDAGSTSVDVLVKDGGLKLLQITDNGAGIEKDDLPILCQRHTTSKLQRFEDLLSIGTYGFRGEALASISYIAHMKVTTKTAGSSCAWQAHFGSGVLVPSKPGQNADPKPCAGRQGTQITVEDLFYNTPNRRKAFRAPSEEYAKILDMVTKYAVHCEGVAFSVKKHGESGAGFTVSAAASTIDRIKQAYGTVVSKELIHFDTESTQWGFRANGFTSNANYSVKRTTILLFINHRSVESSAVKKAVEQTYQLFLPKGGHPFLYLSLEIDPARVDVNVHPTKREVHFLNEEEVIDHVCAEIRQRLAKVDASRTFKTQTVLPGVSIWTSDKARSDSNTNTLSDADAALLKTPTTKKPYENNLVRTDSKMRKITSMLPPALLYTQSTDDSVGIATQPTTRYETVDKEPVQIRLSSVKALRAAVRDNTHETLTETFASLTYVGLVDPSRRLAAIQSGVKLLLVDYGRISNDFFYQVGLTEFGNFGSIRFDPPLSLRELLIIAARIEIETTPDCADLDQDTVVEKVYTTLFERREMLAEYFSLTIDEQGYLQSIPLLLKGYIPCLAKLPTFLLRLGPFVTWTDEQECFRTFLVELASFYVPEQLPPPSHFQKMDQSTTVQTQDHESSRQTPSQSRGVTSPASTKVDNSSLAPRDENPSKSKNPTPPPPRPPTTNISDTEAEIHSNTETETETGTGTKNDPSYLQHTTRRRAEIEHNLEHILFPAFRARLLGTKSMLPGVLEVADLKGLYRVFERC